MNSSPPLASPFPPATEADWRNRVEAALKGADFEKKLTAVTADGIRIWPLYARQADAALIAGRRGAARWQIAQRAELESPWDCNVSVLAELEGGADALVLSFAGHRAARGFGLPADGRSLDKALGGVMLSLIALKLEPGADCAAAAEAVAGLCDRRHHDPKSLAIDFGFDPLAGAGAADIIARLRGLGFTGPFFCCDARPVHEAMGSEAQELASLLAQGAAALRLLETLGCAPEIARRMLSFTIPVDADQFPGIAKLRALRLLWDRVEAACGLAPAPVSIRAETSWRMLTRRDPHVNLLRNTIACFAAAVGGADQITVLPFTAALGLAEIHARRMARNTQLVLMEEASLFRVADPAAGSGGIEALTHELAQKAWALFQEIEREGGLAQSLASGAFPTRIAVIRAARARAIATRREPITGTSEFPDLAELPVAVAAPARRFETGALPASRLAEPFEALRDAADAQRISSGGAPIVTLLTLGTAAQHSARLGFARNFFAAGGIAAEAAAMPDRPAARLVCLCGSDAAYLLEAAPAAQTLAAAGAVVWLAGRPGAQEAGLRAAGVSEFIFSGCDAVQLLAAALRAASALRENAETA